LIPLTPYLYQCAPEIAPSTLSAIVQVESGGDPWTMWDNTARRGYRPTSLQQAKHILRVLMSEGHQVDVGIAQVDTANFAAYGLRPSNAFGVCTNLRVGADILAAAYRKATATYGPGQRALYHAFEVYNSGALHGDAIYANRVLRAAGIPVNVQTGGGLTYARRSQFPAFSPYVLTWGKPQKAAAAVAPKKGGLMYVLNWEQH